MHSSPSVAAIRRMADILLERVLYAQIAWTHSDDVSADAGMALTRTAQRTYEAFLRRFALLPPQK